jgi:hypothetical protein
MTAVISLVLFDMDDVLSHYDRSARVNHLSALSGQAPETVHQAIWGSGLEDRPHLARRLASLSPRLDIAQHGSPGARYGSCSTTPCSGSDKQLSDGV